MTTATVGPERRSPLAKFFEAIARRYDVVNRVFTAWFDERYRRLTARRCLAASPRRVLDVCCGTGDTAIHLARMAPPHAEIVASDFSPAMLAVARRKAEHCGAAGRISFVEGDVADLPFADESFDAITISYAFRNLTYRSPRRDRHLAELLRVLRPGGALLVLETSQPTLAVVRVAYHLYFELVVRPLGALISGHRGAFRYLATSVSDFPNAEAIARLLSDSGFSSVEYTALMLGTVALHRAVK
jgi:demethylmenaquinone methyltransferase/2-methoxy-6-polyprenyl-1,4-benzoquinol methylase